MSLDPQVLQKAVDAAIGLQIETEKRQMLRDPDYLAAQRYIAKHRKLAAIGENRDVIVARKKRRR